MPMPAPPRSSESGLLPGRRRDLFGPAILIAATLVAVTVTSVAMLAINLDRAPQPQEARQPAPPADVKVVGASPDGGKPCDQQTWPYIDKSCLTAAREEKSDRQAEATAAPDKQDSQGGREPGSAAQPSQSVGSMTAIVPTPPVASMAQGTTGVAPKEPTSSAETAAASRPAGEPAKPAPSVSPASYSEPKPAPLAAPASHSEPQQATREARPSQRTGSKVRRTLDEAQPGTQALSSASDEPRKSRRSERRLSSDQNRVVRRWTEYTYNTPGGGQKRVIVIRRGSANDNFFQAMR